MGGVEARSRGTGDTATTGAVGPAGTTRAAPGNGGGGLGAPIGGGGGQFLSESSPANSVLGICCSSSWDVTASFSGSSERWRSLFTPTFLLDFVFFLLGLGSESLPGIMVAPDKRDKFLIGIHNKTKVRVQNYKNYATQQLLQKK